MIPFNRPPRTGNEDQYVREALDGKLCGDGPFIRRCQSWFEGRLGCARAVMTPSCTHALELAALLIDVQPGDEVIMPSYTFASTANAFALRGARIVFVDVRPDTMNMDERLIEPAITDRTKAIVPVHYAGVACDMDIISAVAERYGLYVIGDAAQGMMCRYRDRPLGNLGHLAAYSFHESKNYTSGGEGGLLIVNDSRFADRAEILREKGTNRSQFFRGMVDKYNWIDIGSSYLPSGLQAAYLWGQLERADEILADRLTTWHAYERGLNPLAASGRIELQRIPAECAHNAHMFYVKTRDLTERTDLIDFLRERGVATAFHYVPLHSAPAGAKVSRFAGEDAFTTKESERLLRLPLWYGMQDADRERVVDSVRAYYG